MSQRVELLVLDGQGVVVSAPIKRFLKSLAIEHDVPFGVVERRWEREVRQLAWRGLVDDWRIWKELVGPCVDHETVMNALAARYRPGPAADHLDDWHRVVPIWLLSNHRGRWLRPQLERMDLARPFDRMLISDETGFLKPERNAFQPLLTATAAPGRVLFVDDQAHNVEAARRLGIRAIQASPGAPWVSQVSRAIGLEPSTLSCASRVQAEQVGARHAGDQHH